MGVSIGMHVYNYENLRHRLEQEITPASDQMNPGALLDKVADEFGYRTGNDYVVVWNEYYEDYNAGSELMDLFQRYYELDDTPDALWNYSSPVSAANAYEVAEEIGIELSEDDD